MKEFKQFANWLFYASLFGIIFAAYGAFTSVDLLKLAPTQWVIVSSALVLYALYLKHD